jgi:hypothetical protein
MVNRHRGEIEATLDGVTHRLVLTLGALAELEDAFGDDDMLALATRFEKGRLSARDCMRVIAAGLRGAGLAVSDTDVGQMRAEGGATGYVDIVARLLSATFGGEASEQACDGSREGSSQARGPFAGRP